MSRGICEPRRRPVWTHRKTVCGANQVSLTKSNCWRGCQSAVAHWAIGKRKDSFLTSRSAGVASTTGPACKRRSYADSGEERRERAGGNDGPPPAPTAAMRQVKDFSCSQRLPPTQRIDIGRVGEPVASTSTGNSPKARFPAPVLRPACFPQPQRKRRCSASQRAALPCLAHEGTRLAVFPKLPQRFRQFIGIPNIPQRHVCFPNNPKHILEHSWALLIENVCICMDNGV